ncbi:hypothetical protein [Halopelagius fulvigenes]|uniref:Uncharacterized protein n=1 Tax=Halopelagius fulvigenes TaxID=1198324 RepID=A0ABD5U2B9_9EURY
MSILLYGQLVTLHLRLPVTVPLLQALPFLTVVHAGLKLALEFLAPIFVGSGHSLGLSFAATSQFVDIIGLVAIFYAILR